MLLPAVLSLLLGAAAPEADPPSELVAVARATKAAVVYLERESSTGDFNGSGLLPGLSCTLVIDGLPVWSGQQPVDNLLAVIPAVLFLCGAGAASAAAILG